MTELEAEKAAKHFCASGLPKDEQLPSRLAFDAIISVADFQALRLTQHFRVSPHVAKAISYHAYGEVRQ